MSYLHDINCSDVYDAVFGIYTTKLNEFLNEFVKTDRVTLNKRYILLHYAVGAFVVQQTLTGTANEG